MVQVYIRVVEKGSMLAYADALHGVFGPGRGQLDQGPSGLIASLTQKNTTNNQRQRNSPKGSERNIGLGDGFLIN